jgi:Ca-activated chloride channel family protein
MAQPLPTHFRIHTEWDRPIVPVEGGPAVLLTRIVASQPHASTSRPPIDLAFVLDRSGSMSGEPIELVKQAVSIALDFVDERDRISLVSFDDDVRVWHDLAWATPQQKSMTRAFLRAITVGSSTNLGGGWMKGCQQLGLAPVAGSSRVRRVILLTDGQANVGMTDPSELSSLANTFRRQGISTSTIGVGNHFNEFLLSAMAEASGGNFVFVEHPALLPSFFARETGDMTKVVALAPQLVLTLQPGVTGELLNRFPASMEGSSLTINLRDLIADDDLVLVFEVNVPPGIENSVVALTAHLRFSDGSIVPVEISELRRRPVHEVVAHPLSDLVIQRHAMERSAQMRREAMRSDHEGDIATSRRTLREAHSLLVAAPQSAEIDALSNDINTLADTEARFTESTRKRVIHEVHSQSRGRRTT